MAVKAPIAFRNIQLLKNDVIGIGSYGKVCKAKCDELVCAAKIIHETLVDPSADRQISAEREHRLPVRRFLQECEFLSTIRHPNIVQYLCTYQDPQNGLPVLLMELLDGSLTRFLDNSQVPVPYHIQVNISHDIALALAFLHSNQVIHRDLSGNNVLMIGNVRAKVTDFGMASLVGLSSKLTQHTFTMCPGTEVYMPPEAVDDHPVYSEKMDCFSFGVITLQVLTRQFPKPGKRHQLVDIRHHIIQTETVKMNVPEVERRHNHVNQVDQEHPLRPIILDCLKDMENARPSAQDLCERLAALKTSTQYSESVRGRSSQTKVGHILEEKEVALPVKHHKSHRLRQQIIEKDQIIHDKEAELKQVKEQLREAEDTIFQFERQIDELKRTKRLQTSVNHTSPQEVPSIPPPVSKIDSTPHKREFGKQIESRLDELQDQLDVIERVGTLISENLGGEWEHTDETIGGVCHEHQSELKMLLAELEDNSENHSKENKVDRLKSSDVTSTEVHELKGGSRKWKKAGNISFYIQRKDSDVATSGSDSIYIAHSPSATLHVYNAASKKCSKIADEPHPIVSLAYVNGLLTTIGGQSSYSNKLFSLAGNAIHGFEGWVEAFPPMPSKRWGTTALCTDKHLIVAGGWGEEGAVETVEIMNVETREWLSAADLPEPLCLASGAICGGRVYVAGGQDKDGQPTKAIYACSLDELIRSTHLISHSVKSRVVVWKSVTDLPAFWATCVSVGEHLLSIGGTNDAVPTDPPKKSLFGFSWHTHSTEMATSAVSMYNLETKTWEIVSHMISARSGCFAVKLTNQLVILGGGVKSVETINCSAFL